MTAPGGTTTVAGHEVPRLGFGTMRLTGPDIFGPPADHDECVRTVAAAYEGGVRVFDTSWYYGPDVSSRIVREGLAGADDVVYVSKLGGARTDTGGWVAATSPDEIRAGAERELSLLGIDRIHVVHLRWMPGGSDAQYDEMLDAFEALVADGLIGAIGLSTITVDQLDHARSRGVEVATVSNPYGPGNVADKPVLDRCTELGIPFLPYFAVIGSHASEGIQQVAAETGASPQQVSIAWQLATAPNIVPIPGTSKVAHLRENLAAADLALTPAQLTAIG